MVKCLKGKRSQFCHQLHKNENSAGTLFGDQLVESWAGCFYLNRFYINTEVLRLLHPRHLVAPHFRCIAYQHYPQYTPSSELIPSDISSVSLSQLTLNDRLPIFPY